MKWSRNNIRNSGALLKFSFFLNLSLALTLNALPFSGTLFAQEEGDPENAIPSGVAAAAAFRNQVNAPHTPSLGPRPTLAQIQEALDAETRVFPKIEDLVSTQYQRAGDSYIRIWFSGKPYDSGNKKVTTGADLGQVLIQFLTDVVSNTNELGLLNEKWRKAPAKLKSLYLDFYHIELEEIYKKLEEAANQGFGEAQMIIDSNDYFTFTDAVDKPYRNDIQNAQFKANNFGKLLKNILRGDKNLSGVKDAFDPSGKFSWAGLGLKVKNLAYIITGQPVFSKGIKPIHHMKGALAVLRNEKGGIEEIIFFRGSYNPTLQPRENYLSATDDRAIGTTFLEHFQAAVPNYSNGGRIQDIKEPTWKRILFKNGDKESSITLTFVDGKNVTNAITGNLFTSHARTSKNPEDPNYTRIGKIRGDHFAPAYNIGNEAIRVALEEGEKFEGDLLADEDFVRPDSFGEGARFGGHMTVPPGFGPVRWPLPQIVLDSIKLGTWSRAIPGHPQTNLEGEPQNEINHPKTWIIRLAKRVNGGIKKIVHTAWKTDNWSKAPNYELQEHVEEPEEDAVLAPILEKYMDSKWAQAPLLGAYGPFKLSLAVFLGMSAHEIDDKLNQEIYDAFANGNSGAAFSKIRSLVDVESKIGSRPPKLALQNKIKVLEDGNTKLEELFGRGRVKIAKRPEKVAAMMSSALAHLSEPKIAQVLMMVAGAAPLDPQSKYAREVTELRRALQWDQKGVRPEYRLGNLEDPKKLLCDAAIAGVAPHNLGLANGHGMGVTP